MKESSKFNIAASVSAVTSVFVSILGSRKFPNFDKDVEYRNLFKSRDDATNIVGKWSLSLGVDLICVGLGVFAGMVSFLGTKSVLDYVALPEKKEKKLLNDEEVHKIEEHWKEKDSTRLWQEKINSQDSICSQVENGLKHL